MMPQTLSARRAFVAGKLLLIAGTVIAVGVVAVALATPRVPTTVVDFYFHGTQPQANRIDGGTLDPLFEPQYCGGCHQDFSGEQPNSYTIPYQRWSYSMMAHAYRDPIFQAQFQIANTDAGDAGSSCLKCHAPVGWLENRGMPADGSALAPLDTNGVSCSVCHRMVDPVEQPFPSPSIGGPPGSFDGNTDRDLLIALGADRPPNFANGGPTAANGMVIDTMDRRRGPFDLNEGGYSMNFHNWIKSDFHNTAGVCASCHDVSNPAYLKQANGRYVMTEHATPHPTGNKYDMYPMDRTYSEWSKSDFGTGGVVQTVPNPNTGVGTVGRYSFDGVTRNSLSGELIIFNGKTNYTSCQDCHQPESSGQGCEINPPIRQVPVHNFNGGNTWVLRSVWDIFGFDSLMTNPVEVDEAVERNKQMLARGTDLTTTVAGGVLTVRVINEAGHKFPSGFSEGRRAWVNVRYFTDATLISEVGGYNFETAVLSEANTKVYQSLHGLDTAAALLTGLPPGHSYHIDLNNVHIFDNRIPPRGFNNAVFDTIQAKPVGYSYADGQHWDDTAFSVPSGATSAEVRLYYQTTSRDYIEFLRDTATAVSGYMPQPAFIDPDTQEVVNVWSLPAGYPAPVPPVNLPMGQIAHAQWVKWGKSAPVQLDYALVSLTAPPATCLADVASDSLDDVRNPNNSVGAEDLDAFISGFIAENVAIADVASDSLDTTFNPNGSVGSEDLDAFIAAFIAGC